MKKLFVVSIYRKQWGNNISRQARIMGEAWGLRPGGFYLWPPDSQTCSSIHPTADGPTYMIGLHIAYSAPVKQMHALPKRISNPPSNLI